MSEELVRRKLPGYATEFREYASGAWELRAHDVGLLLEALGEPLVWGIARCFEAADRLMSLSFLVPGDDVHQASPAKALRDHFTAFWLAAGTMRELSVAILALPGMRRRLQTPDALRTWYSLQAIARRWNRDDLARTIHER